MNALDVSNSRRWLSLALPKNVGMLREAVNKFLHKLVCTCTRNVGSAWMATGLSNLPMHSGDHCKDGIVSPK